MFDPNTCVKCHQYNCIPIILSIISLLSFIIKDNVFVPSNIIFCTKNSCSISTETLKFWYKRRWYIHPEHCWVWMGSEASLWTWELRSPPLPRPWWTDPTTWHRNLPWVASSWRTHFFLLQGHECPSVCKSLRVSRVDRHTPYPHPSSQNMLLCYHWSNTSLN